MGGQAGTAGAGHASEPHNADFAPIGTASPPHSCQAGTAGAGHASEPDNADSAPIATSSPHHLDQAGTAGAGHALQAEELLTEFGRAQGMEDCLQGHAHQVHAAGPFAEPPA